MKNMVVIMINKYKEYTALFTNFFLILCIFFSTLNSMDNKLSLHGLTEDTWTGIFNSCSLHDQYYLSLVCKHFHRIFEIRASSNDACSFTVVDTTKGWINKYKNWWFPHRIDDENKKFELFCKKIAGNQLNGVVTVSFHNNPQFALFLNSCTTNQYITRLNFTTVVLQIDAYQNSSVCALCH